MTFLNSPCPCAPLQGDLTLVEEISHRVMNEYTAVIAHLSLAAASTGDAAVRHALRGAAQQLRLCAAAHRALQRPLAPADIDLADHLEQLCRALCEATPRERGIRIELTTESCLLSADRCWRVGLICAELITNAVRHGRRGRSAVVRVSMVCSDDRVQCGIFSEGEAASAARPGLGSRIVGSLAQQLGGGVDWRYGGRGVAAVLSFRRAADV